MSNILNYWREALIFFLLITTLFYFGKHIEQTKEYNILVDEYNNKCNDTDSLRLGKWGNSYHTNGEDVNPHTPLISCGTL
jgi:hypothetical protein